MVKFYSLGFACTLFLLLPALEKCTPTDFLIPSQPMRNGETLVSADKMFQLGFFHPNNVTSSSYLGIWFYNISSQAVVWVANRENPLNGSGTLKIGDDGNLVIADQLERVIWSSNAQNLSSKSTVARLLDSGNLVLIDNTTDSSTESYLWQSFDHPTDTLLAEMRLGWNLSSGAIWQLTSWKDLDDPSPGEFSHGENSHGFPYAVVLRGDTKIFRGAPSFSNTIPANSLFRPMLIYDYPDVYYYVYYLQNRTTRTRVTLNYKGTLDRYLWNDQSMQWVLLYSLPGDACDEYAKCGPNTVCNVVNYLANCSCFTGYTPKSSQDLDTSASSGGCVRKKPLNCTGTERFEQIKAVKVPDLLQFELNASMTASECREKCLWNCTCTAYAITNGSGDGSGCGLWFGDLLDTRVRNDFINDLFIKVLASDLESDSLNKFPWKWVAPVGTLALVTFAVLLCLAFQKKRKAEGGNGRPSAASHLAGLVGLDVQVNDEESFDLPVFDAISISEATNNFSNSNKLGQGGFGPVYKGRLPNGQEIAVKKLSLDSSQGLNEFKNEVMLIAKLQHRNLVRLLGCCIEGEERMLIYEYMPNKSLDFFIFGNGDSLPWSTRFNIIVGIARGILYLHRDSRLRIIHRDLKASNVLLDNEMNAKISDFGMARAFGENLSLARTQRIVGTYGYMSPEYAIDGLFSVKSDVFSFGVLVLEIISGKRNREFHHAEHNFNLLGHAWKSWKDGKAFELIDSNMEATLYLSEIMRCIQVGLLCVQRHPEDRPTMPYVVLMLDSGICVLPEPKEPGFYTERSHDQSKVNTNSTDCSINEMTLTLLNGR